MLQKMSTFPHSAYIEDCCESLGKDEEYPSDRYLLHIVRLQYILEKVNRLSFQHRIEPRYPDPAVELYVSNFKSDLELFKERLPFAIHESSTCPIHLPSQIALALIIGHLVSVDLLRMQLHTVELFLYQISLFEQNSELDETITCPSSWSPWRLEVLCAGLASSKLLFDCYLTLPLRTEMAFNNTEWVQLGFALIVASRFSVAGTKKSVSHDTMSMRQSLDMSGVLKQSILRLGGLISPRSDINGERDVFYHYEKRARNLQCWFEKHCLKQPMLLPHDSKRVSDSSSQIIAPFLQRRPEGNALDNTTEFSSLAEGLLPDQTLYSQVPEYFPDDIIDGMMGDWMSYPMFPFS